MIANGQVYETFGISESKLFKKIQFLLSVTNLKSALSAKCFTYSITVCNLYFQDIIYLIFSAIFKKTAQDNTH